MLDQALRTAFPDFHVDIQWQIAADNLLTTDKIYHGTQSRPILGVAPTGRTVESETVDVMKVWNGKISDHWGVGDLLKMMMHIGAITITPDQFTRGMRTGHPGPQPAMRGKRWRRRNSAQFTGGVDVFQTCAIRQRSSHGLSASAHGGTDLWVTEVRPRPAPVRAMCWCGHAAGRVDEGGPGGLTAESEIIDGGTQFEQGRALAASQLESGADADAETLGFGVGVGAKSEQFGVIEAHSGIAGQCECGVQLGASLMRVHQRRSITVRARRQTT